MRIGFSTSVIQRGRTGIAQHVFALLRAIDKCQSDDSFFVFTLEEDLPFFSTLSPRFTLVPVPEKFRPAVRNIAWHQTILPNLVAHYGLDLFHVPSYRRLLWSAPCPSVGTIHDLAPFKVSGKYDLARMFYGRVIVKQLARRQEAIIAVSENTARDVQRFFGISRSKLRVIWNGLDHERFYPRHRGAAAALAAQKYKLEKPFFLYVARLEHPGKNHLRLIEAFEKFKETTRSPWQLAFGGSDWHGAETIHQRIAASSCRNDIRALGFVSDEDLPLLYSAAQVFVYPSLYEGFGMPPVEAMACGCPVICSDRGSLGEIVGDCARIIDPEDVVTIQASLEELYRDDHARSALIERGQARAREFSWDRAARETLDVYRTAASHNVDCNEHSNRPASPRIFRNEIRSATL